MKYRNFGNTGLQISEIAFGGGARGGIVIRPDPETRLEAVRRSLEYGITWIDTAAQYGDGQSETNLGHILKDLNVNPNISTKMRIGPEHVGDIMGEMQRSMESLTTSDSVNTLRKINNKPSFVVYYCLAHHPHCWIAHSPILSLEL